MAHYREWSGDYNSRGFYESICEGEHVSLPDLKKDQNLDSRYLRRTNIPRYPENVVFSTSDVCHVTGENALRGIIEDGGFQASSDGDENYVWWSLAVSEDDIANAEENFFKSIFPYQYYDDDQPFLNDFTTSPAFQNQSRYGNFKFTFTLRELLHSYAKQFCVGWPPVLRVMDTRVYKQEIMYSVLVHPPQFNRHYDRYPRLPREDEDGDEVCGYSQGRMWWRCQSPSNAYDHKLVIDREECTVWGMELKGEQYYVWDHVAVAFHMQPHWTLRLNKQRLLNSVSVCKMDPNNLSGELELSSNAACGVIWDLQCALDYGLY